MEFIIGFIMEFINTSVEAVRYGMESHPLWNLAALMGADVKPILSDTLAMLYFVLCGIIFAALAVPLAYRLNEWSVNHAHTNRRN